MYGVGFSSIFLVPFILAAFIYTCRRLGCGLLPTFVASIFFILAPIYLKRSTFAWFDDDAYNVFFPLLISGLLFQALDQLKNIKKLILFAVLIAVAMAIYTRFWYGWGFMWGLSAASVGLIALLSLIRNRTNLRPTIILTLTLTVTPFIAVGLLYGFGEVWQILTFATGELKKFIAPSLKDWPDLFIVVGELKKSSLKEVVELTGGPIMFFGGIIAAAGLAIQAAGQYNCKAAKTTFLIFFFSITFYLALSAQRFTILCLTPISLLFALGLEEIWSHRRLIAEKIGLKSAGLQKTLAGVIAALMLLSLAQPLYNANKGIRLLLSPIFNSAWERALTKLRDHSPTDSIVNSWWSPGHFVKAIAKRKVTFDGASINGEQAYWLTKVYLSQTEEEALGILRMLNLSSNQAADYLKKKGIPLSMGVPLLLKATSLDQTNAYNLYQQYLSVADADALIKMTHGTPPPSYVLIYNEIVEGNVLLGYLGKWNFKRIEELNSHPELRKQVPSRSSPAYVNFIWSLVGGPYRQSPTLNPAKRNGSSILFDHGVILNTSDMTVTVKSPQFGTGIPESIFYVEGNEIKEKKLPNASLSYSVVLFKDSSNAPRCVLMDRIIANSLIARMYYFDGVGLQHFKLFSKESDLTGRTKIFIYEVKW